MINDFYPGSLDLHKFAKYTPYLSNSIGIILLVDLINNLSINPDFTFTYNGVAEKAALSMKVTLFWLTVGIANIIYFKKAVTKLSFDDNKIKLFNCWGRTLREINASEVKKIEFHKSKLYKMMERGDKKIFHPKDLWIYTSNDYILKVAWEMGDYTIFVKQIEKWSGLYLPEEEVKWLEKNRGNSVQIYDGM